jgi:trans-feruloyl-CoA hydratase/vanillin synthase
MSTSDKEGTEVDEKETVIVEYDKETNVTTITLNRPENKNAMNPTLHREMIETMEEVKEDALDPEGSTHILVLTGAEDSFCAGQDLEESFLDYEDDPYEATQRSKMSGEWANELFNFPVPTVAAVNGYAFGGGFRVCCMCDLAIASEEATFGLSEVNFGHLVAGGTTMMASYTLSPRDFKYLAYSGKPIDAEEADKIRLVNDVVPHDELYDEVYELAEDMAEKNTMAMQMCKEVYMNEWRQGMRRFLDARSYETGKARELDWLQENESMRAIEAFVDDKYKPGQESYTEEDLED